MSGAEVSPDQAAAITKAAAMFVAARLNAEATNKTFNDAMAVEKACASSLIHTALGVEGDTFAVAVPQFARMVIVSMLDCANPSRRDLQVWPMLPIPPDAGVVVIDSAPAGAADSEGGEA